MEKASLKFSDSNSLLLFAKQTTAINVNIKPLKNIITGLFNPEEIGMAVKEFNAIQLSDNFAERNLMLV